MAAFVLDAGATAAAPDGDAPDPAIVRPAAYAAPPSYADALRTWRNAEDVDAWIAARFEYDAGRAMRLSETQRAAEGRIAIHAPSDFYEHPSGVCVDLARFGVETLREIDPGARPAYLMIEFDPATIGGNVLRRHWIATFERDGKRWFFADSRRPGVLAGPYDDTAAFVADYARYRHRGVVAWRELDGWERRTRTLAERKPRAERR